MLRLCLLIMVFKNVGRHCYHGDQVFLCSAAVERVFSLLIFNHSQHPALEDYSETAVNA